MVLGRMDLPLLSDREGTRPRNGRPRVRGQECLGRPGVLAKPQVTIALGICTYNRPAFFEKTAKAVARQFGGRYEVYVYDDGSDPKHRGSYARAYRALPEAHLGVGEPNRGVAFAKNRLLEQMLAGGAEWLVLCEDDIVPLSPHAIELYVEAAEASGLEHLSFAHHGPANAHGAVSVDLPHKVAFYTHAVGAWCLYSRRCLEVAGLFDEHFVNAWEHVEHTLRLAEAGFTSGAYRFADAWGSERHVGELPRAIDTSVIRPRPDWRLNIVEGMAYWRDAHPATWLEMFGPGKPLEAYAAGVLSEAGSTFGRV